MNLSLLLSLAIAAVAPLRVAGSEECIRVLTTDCDAKKTACLQDCYGRTLQNLEYVEISDAGIPDSGLESDALGIVLQYTDDERLLIDSLPHLTEWLYVVYFCHHPRVRHDLFVHTNKTMLG